MNLWALPLLVFTVIATIWMVYPHFTPKRRRVRAGSNKRIRKFRHRMYTSRAGAPRRSARLGVAFYEGQHAARLLTLNKHVQRAMKAL